MLSKKLVMPEVDPPRAENRPFRSSSNQSELAQSIKFEYF